MYKVKTELVPQSGQEENSQLIIQSQSIIQQGRVANFVSSVKTSLLSFADGDNSKEERIFGTLHLLGWKNVAEKINDFSKEVTNEQIRIALSLDLDIPFQLTARQREKFIITLLGKMLIFYARQTHIDPGPFDVEIGKEDIKECIQLFGITQNQFFSATNYAKLNYKNYFNDGLLEEIYNGKYLHA